MGQAWISWKILTSDHSHLQKSCLFKCKHDCENVKFKYAKWNISIFATANIDTLVFCSMAAVR